MARGFGATHGVANRTDLIASALTTTSTLRSWMLLYNADTWQDLTRLWDQRSGSGAENEVLLKVTGSLLLKYFRRYTTTPGEWTITQPSTDTWHRLVMTYDSGNTANNPLIWMDGTPLTVTRAVAPVGAPTTDARPYNLGNLSFDAGVDVNINGHLAEFAVWNRLLSAPEVAALQTNTSPKSSAVVDTVPLNTSLVEYIPMLQTDAPVISCVLANPTVTGTLATAHPYASIGCAFGGLGGAWHHRRLMEA